MDLTLTEDQELIRDTARELLAARATAAGARAMEDDPAGWSRALWTEMAELGWTGLAVPEAHGGVGAGFLESCLLIEEMGRFQIPGPFVSTLACCGLPIARFGTSAQRERWLGAIAGGAVMAYARAAPRGRWDVAGSDVVATETADGYLLDGTAAFVSHATEADGLVVVARRAPGKGEPTGAGGADGSGGPDGGLIVFVLEATTQGITHEPVEVIGIDRRCHVGFERVTVPGDAVLGDVGAGARVVEAISAYGAAATCAEMVGGADRVLEMTIEYATEREQFGRAIGGFQAVQHHCADMAMDVLGARFIAYEAIWRLGENLDAAVEVATAKAWVSEAYERVCALGHQVHGAIGFTREHELQTYSRHATASALSFGDGDHHWDRLAGLIGLPRS
jgi:3-oxocholest-4-en-26-oyl-CoA dehydrogenase beta subunit